MKVLILAAGYGTRLYPLTLNTPKPLLKVGNRPIIDHILEKVNLPGLKEVLVISNDKFEKHFEEWAREHKNFPCPIKVVNDGTKTNDDRLGSIGDIDFALKNKKIDDDLLVIGGDNIFDYDLKEYINFARKMSPRVTIGLYDIHDKEQAKLYGVVELDQNRKVVSFEEKPQAPRSTFISMCLYYFSKSSLSLIEQYLQETKKADKAGDYISWLYQREEVFGFKFQGKWYDIGSIESYNLAQEGLKQ